MTGLSLKGEKCIGNIGNKSVEVSPEVMRAASMDYILQQNKKLIQEVNSYQIHLLRESCKQLKNNQGEKIEAIEN